MENRTRNESRRRYSTFPRPCARFAHLSSREPPKRIDFTLFPACMNAQSFPLLSPRFYCNRSGEQVRRRKRATRCVHGHDYVFADMNALRIECGWNEDY